MLLSDPANPGLLMFTTNSAAAPRVASLEASVSAPSCPTSRPKHPNAQEMVRLQTSWPASLWCVLRACLSNVSGPASSALRVGSTVARRSFSLHADCTAFSVARSKWTSRTMKGRPARLAGACLCRSVIPIGAELDRFLAFSEQFATRSGLR